VLAGETPLRRQITIEPNAVGYVVLPELPDQTSVVIHGVAKRDDPIGGSVIGDELAAVRDVLAEIGIHGVGRARIELLHPIHIHVDIEGHWIPIRVVRHDIAEIVGADPKLL
jgi:hypothetical protein